MCSNTNPLQPSYVIRLIFKQSGLKATRSHSLRVASISRNAADSWFVSTSGGGGVTACVVAGDANADAEADANTNAGADADADAAALCPEAGPLSILITSPRRERAVVKHPSLVDNIEATIRRCGTMMEEIILMRAASSIFLPCLKAAFK